MPDDPTSQTGTDTNAPGGEGTEKPAPDMATIANQAASAHAKRLEKQMKEQIAASIAEATKPLLDQLAALSKPTPQGGSGDEKNKPDPVTLALQQEVAELKSKAKDAEIAKAAAEKRARDERAFASFRTELSKHVLPGHLDVLAKHLFENSVTVDDEGNATFKSKVTQYGVTDDVDLPLDVGVNNWAKTEAAKVWIPAPGSPSNTPNSKKPNGSTNLKPFNPDTATDQEKLDHARRLELSILAKQQAQ